MNLEINSTLRGQPVAIETYMGISLDTAFQHAKDMVNTGIADRVEIKQDGKLVRQWPRTLKPVPGVQH
jgi:hypothetical protein